MRCDCPLRDPTRPNDVEFVARQLSALQACGDALAEGRVCDGVALEPLAGARATCPEAPTGFRVAEVLAAYGGPEAVESACGGCVAHAGRGERPWAGCCGLVDWSSLGAGFFELVDREMAAVASLERWSAWFLETRPAWYGLWAPRPGENLEVPTQQLFAYKMPLDCLALFSPFFARLRGASPAADRMLAPVARAVDVALQTGLPLDVRLFPAGRVEGKRWEVPPHCGRCSAARPDPRRPCPVCRSPLAPLPARRRAAQGARPYWPLVKQLGPESTAQLLERHWRQRGGAS